MKKKNLIIDMRYTKDQLEKVHHYDLFPIAAELKIPTRPDGKDGSKKEIDTKNI
jgi:hypothetical protein